MALVVLLLIKFLSLKSLKTKPLFYKHKKDRKIVCDRYEAFKLKYLEGKWGKRRQKVGTVVSKAQVKMALLCIKKNIRESLLCTRNIKTH